VTLGLISVVDEHPDFCIVLFPPTCLRCVSDSSSPPPGRGVPFVAVYKTQRDGESETQDRESECSRPLLWIAFARLRIVLKSDLEDDLEDNLDGGKGGGECFRCRDEHLPLVQHDELSSHRSPTTGSPHQITT